MLDTVKATKLVLDKNERIAELEEENKFLKAEIELLKKHRFSYRYFKRLEEENKKLKSDLCTVIDERDNAFNKIKQLEQRLDNKEKVNKQLREELGKLVMKE